MELFALAETAGSSPSPTSSSSSSSSSASSPSPSLPLSVRHTSTTIDPSSPPEQQPQQQLRTRSAFSLGVVRRSPLTPLTQQNHDSHADEMPPARTHAAAPRLHPASAADSAAQRLSPRSEASASDTLASHAFVDTHPGSPWLRSQSPHAQSTPDTALSSMPSGAMLATATSRSGHELSTIESLSSSAASAAFARPSSSSSSASSAASGRPPVSWLRSSCSSSRACQRHWRRYRWRTAIQP
mmetsp:Transcript_8520/g.26413  ORF Transcript_8520/g.26413 Transcript_8520/m.26413 type:complete len:241 (+) Transcript_8520:70-792(+)